MEGNALAALQLLVAATVRFGGLWQRLDCRLRQFRGDWAYRRKGWIGTQDSCGTCNAKFCSGGNLCAGGRDRLAGFLVPELARISSFTKTALISGAAWSLYHYPLIVFADYNNGTPMWFALLAFTWMVVASSFIYAWLRPKSGSLWTAVILHASHNLYIQDIFDPLTQDRGITKYVTTEFGIGFALAYTVVAFYFWKRRGELLSSSTEITETSR